MEFICYLLGCITDLIVLIVLLPIYQCLRILGFEKLTTFVGEIITKIVKENGLF